MDTTIDDTTTASRANVFINWINDKLKPVNLEIKDIKEFGTDDGVIAKELIQILTQKEVPPDTNIIKLLVQETNGSIGDQVDENGEFLIMY